MFIVFCCLFDLLYKWKFIFKVGKVRNELFWIYRGKIFVVLFVVFKRIESRFLVDG